MKVEAETEMNKHSSNEDVETKESSTKIHKTWNGKGKADPEDLDSGLGADGEDDGEELA